MSRPLLPCGTYAAYQRHMLRGERPCRACKDANNEYRRGLRGRGILTTDPVTENARKRAQARLAHAFPEEIAKGIASARAAS